MTEQWYEVMWERPYIRPVDVVRFTKKSVWLAEEPSRRRVRGRFFFPSLVEAGVEMSESFVRSIDFATDLCRRASARIESFNACAEAESVLKRGDG